MIDMSNILYELSLLGYVLPKILIATICGFLVGWERERKNKVAGLRTIVLICVGSTIFTISSFMVGNLYNVDPTRILSTIVTGIGFLGGGVIMKNDDRIVGLTTAAFIWVIAGIGILCGMGSVIMPIFLTVGLLVVSWLFEGVEKYIKIKSRDKKEN